MVTLDQLRTQVASQYALQDLPAWPDPHPNHEAPLPAEYSRLTDPKRYRIVHARARAWSTVLTRALDVATDPWSAPAADDARDERFTRGVRLTSSSPDTLPLLLLEADDPLPMLLVCVSDRSWVLSRQPACGCDACDDGSQHLLRGIDDVIGAFLQGPSVLMRGPTWTSSWSPGTSEAGGDPGHPDFETLMATSRSLASGEPAEVPRGAACAVSQSWLT